MEASDKIKKLSKDLEIIELIKLMDRHMAEQYMRHDYRSMWEIWQMIIEKIK